MSRECVGCKHIDNCETVTPDKILSHYVCDDYEEVEKQVKVRARCDVINKFGMSGLKALIKPNAEES